ncbi:MAG: flagellar basal body rod protein FlgB [Devosiaceae bacterium]|nr:flagellar basal body rod protein FlgB [Devosiaceae bacterium MH13]
MLTDMPFFSALKTQMRWHSERQSLIAENIANADTPGFTARDLERIDHEARNTVGSPMAVAPSRTDVKHIQGATLSTSEINRGQRVESFEVTPEGNSVVLEEEVMKMTTNQLDYQAVASLYQKSLSMIRLAIAGR